MAINFGILGQNQQPGARIIANLPSQQSSSSGGGLEELFGGLQSLAKVVMPTSPTPTPSQGVSGPVMSSPVAAMAPNSPISSSVGSSLQSLLPTQARQISSPSPSIALNRVGC